jgi:hypothetical protein
LDHNVVTAIKRQVPFLIGGTITGVIMTYYVGFFVTLLVNSIAWYIISQITYKLLWRKSALADQKNLLGYFLNKIKSQKHPRMA